MIATTRPTVSVSEPTLYVAFELSARSWKLASTIGFGIPPWLRAVPAGDLGAVARVVVEARRRWQLSATTPVVSCMRAGRDGFWIHRALVAQGIANRVVDSASIDVKRRARRAKTDRLDALKLVMMLMRVCCGEPDVWSEVRVPSEGDEAARHVSRERTALIQERTRIVNQTRSWLATYGGRLPTRRCGGWWTQVRDWNGAPLPATVQARLARADARLTLIGEQLETIGSSQEAVRAAAHPCSALARLVQAERRRHHRRVGAHRRRPGLARVSESARDRQPARVYADALSRAGSSRRSKGLVEQGIVGCRRSVCSSLGNGCAGSPRVRSRSGLNDAMLAAASVCDASASWRWRGAWSSRSGGTR